MQRQFKIKATVFCPCPLLPCRILETSPDATHWDVVVDKGENQQDGLETALTVFLSPFAIVMLARENMDGFGEIKRAKIKVVNKAKHGFFGEYKSFVRKCRGRLSSIFAVPGFIFG